MDALGSSFATQGCGSKRQLKAVWQLLQQLQAWTGEPWSKIEDWCLLPLHDDSLLKIKHRQLVFAKPNTPSEGLPAVNGQLQP